MNTIPLLVVGGFISSGTAGTGDFGVCKLRLVATSLAPLTDLLRSSLSFFSFNSKDNIYLSDIQSGASLMRICKTVYAPWKKTNLSCLCLARNSRFFTKFTMMFWTNSSTSESCSPGGEASLNALCCTSLDGRVASLNAMSLCCTSLDGRGALVNAMSFCSTSLDRRGASVKTSLFCTSPQRRASSLVDEASVKNIVLYLARWEWGWRGFFLGGLN